MRPFPKFLVATLATLALTGTACSIPIVAPPLTGTVMLRESSALPSRSIAAVNAQVPEQITAYNLDWDDNAFFMPTKVVIFNESTGKERIMSTADFAVIREQLGKHGEWTPYATRNDDQTGSFRYFREGPRGENYFLLDVITGLKDVFETLHGKLSVDPTNKHLIKNLDDALREVKKIRKGQADAIKRQDEIITKLKSVLTEVRAALKSRNIVLHAPKNRGPSWDALVRALKHPQTAKWSTFITARGHPEEHMHDGLFVFYGLGYFDHLPPIGNYDAVTHPKNKATAENPSAAKVVKMRMRLDRIQSIPTSETFTTVLSPDGKSTRKMHLWGFSDDDFGNYATALRELAQDMKNGRWPDVKIFLFFTGGKNNPNEKARVMVLQPDGTPRAATDQERTEAARIHCEQLTSSLSYS